MTTCRPLPSPLRLTTLLLAATALLVGAGAARAQAPSFVNFESGQVRPLALSPDGSRLFAVNTPDNRLEIFAVGAGGALTHTAAVPVGLEPVAVAPRGNGEVWVVNHLSDSVSVVDVSSSPPRVVRTLLVGDEPRDIVFAGPGGNRAFVTTAHRGQNIGFDPQLTTAGVGRADVWVFDATNLGTSLGGTPLTIVTLFGDTPRALAASADGSKVYAAVYFSGNRTTVISEGGVCDDGATAGPCNSGQSPGGMPAPNANFQGQLAPETGLIVKYNPVAGQWQDELGRNWNNAVRFNLPDLDVFAIDANATTPAQVQSWSGVGTVLFNMVASPTDPDKLYVTNTEARNEVRFEGPGLALSSTTVRGRLHEARVTVIDGTSVLPRHLNKHIDYDQIPPPAGTPEKSLATPVGMAVSSDGQTLYVAAFGSSKVGVFSTGEIDANTFVPDAADHATLTGGGPSGLVLDEARSRLYVLTRFDNSISVVDTTTLDEVAHVPVYNPEPAHVVAGRPVLYDAAFSSSNGEASCSSCHVFGDLDQLAWDLGNPDDPVTSNPMNIRLALFASADEINGDAELDEFHPMKGPMTTQTLRGLSNSGPMHWRGDRSNGFFGVGTDEALSFDNFIVAFEGLLGRESLIPTTDMQDFTDFALTMTLPPNPIRALNNALTADQQAGRNFYVGSRRSDGIAIGGATGFNCNGCHTLDPSQGFFGTNGDASFENELQIIKVAHLRNLYQKVGMFGMMSIDFLNPGDNGHKGDQIRGFGFLHDGSVDTVFRFFQATVFNNANGVGFNGGDTQRRQMEQFMLAFDSDLAPIVGQQITLTSSNSAAAGPRIDLLLQRAGATFTSKVLGGTTTECDVVVKGNVAGAARGWLRTSAGTFRSDRASEPLLNDVSLRALAATAGQELTYTCVPPGSGTRIGIDRDLDTYYDRDELDAGTDPANPSDYPGSPTPTPTPSASPTPTPTGAPTATPTPAPTASPTPSPGATPSPGPTATPTPTAGATPTPTPGAVPVTGIRNSALVLKDDVLPPINPDARTMRFRSATYQGVPGGAYSPAFGTTADPTLLGASGGGAVLTVYNAALGEKVVLNLPASGWQRIGNSVSPGYKYRDTKRLSGPVTQIALKNGRLSVSGKGGALYGLANAPQGTVALRLRLGSGVEFCAVAPAKAPVASNDTTAKFVSASNTSAPVSCPPVP